MTEETTTRPIILAGKTIEVPRLPIRLNLDAYPLCRKLTNAELPQRYFAAVAQQSTIDITKEEYIDLADLAFIAAKAADPTLERSAFDEWTIAPHELPDAFFPIRIQTGGWVAGTPKEDDGEDQEEEAPGEAEGASTPPK